jgi:DNA-binding GntR family transcriptional regulator
MSDVLNSRPREGAKLGPRQPPTPDAQSGLTTHESVYRVLRERILVGGFPPGRAVTLRGLADELGTSAMPIREAVRRLIAERALTMRDNRRVLVPEMTRAKFNQVVFARQMLEPELAARALRNMAAGDIKTVAGFDQSVDRAMAKGDVEGYMRGNFEFHFGIYRLAQNDMLLGLVESIWLQFGPFMRMAYGHFDTSQLEDFHQAAVKAMKAGDEAGLRAAIAADIGQGMSFIGEEVLANVEAAKSAAGALPVQGATDAPS